MGTRAIVGIGTTEDFRALYNHWDGYPTGLGKEFWDEVQKHKDDLEGFAKELLKYDDWRNYQNEGICQFCGKKTTQPHSLGIIEDANSYKQALAAVEGGFGPPAYGPRVTDKQIESYWNGMPWAREQPGRISEAIAEDKKALANFKATGFPDPDAKRHQHYEDPPPSLQFTPEGIKDSWLEWAYLVDLKTRAFCVYEVRFEKGLTPIEAFPIDGPEPDWKKVEGSVEEDEE